MIMIMSRFIKLLVLLDSQRQTRFRKITVHGIVKTSSSFEHFLG